jgi:hypothetical protein
MEILTEFIGIRGYFNWGAAQVTQLIAVIGWLREALSGPADSQGCGHHGNPAKKDRADVHEQQIKQVLSQFYRREPLQCSSCIRSCFSVREVLRFGVQSSIARVQLVLITIPQFSRPSGDEISAEKNKPDQGGSNTDPCPVAEMYSRHGFNPPIQGSLKAVP